MVNGWTVPGFTHARDLGGGAAGRVVLAVDDLTQTQVAIKYLDSRLDSDEVFLSRYRMTARRLSQLEDPNVVDLFDLVETPQGTAIVMDCVEGVTLRRILDAQGPTGPLAALSVLGGMLLGLAAAHDKEIVHGALRPTNVIVDGRGNALLTDFGMTPSGDAAQAGPAYAAPELWNGAPAGASSDLYAATAVFFECLTGAPPFTGRSLAKAHRETPVPVDAVPGPLRDIIALGLAKDAEKRPASAADFLGAVEEAAVAAYGPSWEAQGRGRITELAQQAGKAKAPAPDKSRSSGKNPVTAPARSGGGKARPLIAVAAGLVIVAGIAGAVVSLNRGKDTPAPTPATSGNPQPVPTVDPALAEAASLAGRVQQSVARPTGATFTFRRTGAGAGATAQGTLGLLESAPASYSMTVAGTGGTRKAGKSIVIRDTTYLRAGRKWRPVPYNPRARGYAGLAAQVRQETAVTNVPALLRSSTAFRKTATGFEGTASLAKLAQEQGIGELFADLARRSGATEITYTLQVDRAYHPVRVTLRTHGTAKARTLAYQTTYAGWGRKVTISAPR
ncbi:Serine/threonine-protein kinase PrkC [Actinomadura rubteroloni]|uniref:non-specific serine/threonine protein kinase n=1 Tax=Actinomadura rubteroloni TaxID=1926885 RepID=A0A2P4UKH3_9ACTN|nr:serine/threonine-protein kinase [Actinomadura rubteroloni]POM25554.1 Serine/threonine-protein kinase PrkC [Actinomadura rubteroloni]